MSDTSTPVENVGRGTLVALLSIPLAIIAFSLVAGFFGIITGLVAIVVPSVTAWLYSKGAGAPLKAGKGAFVGVAAAAVILGTVSGIIASTYYGFTKVGGDGGLFGSAFATTLRRQFTTGLGDNFFALLIGLGLGAAAIIGIVRGNQRLLTKAANPPVPVAPAAPTAPATYATTSDAAAPPAAVTPPAPPAAPVVPNQPSPGIILNGKPLDPDGKKK